MLRVVDTNLLFMFIQNLGNLNKIKPKMQDAGVNQVCRETSSWELILSNFNDPAEQEKIKVGMEYCKKVEGYANELSLIHI